MNHAVLIKGRSRRDNGGTYDQKSRRGSKALGSAVPHQPIKSSLRRSSLFLSTPSLWSDVFRCGENLPIMQKGSGSENIPHVWVHVAAG